ncbi:MAG TPA: hypothetical protein VNA24_24105 [Hyalangium sp.]|nr:hypothetical protein [Hyalangium sp.]
MSRVKIGSSPAPAPKTSRPTAESKPAVARSSESGSGGTRIGVPRDEFIKASGGTKPKIPGIGKAQETAPTLPKELEPFRAELDSLAEKLSLDPELVEDRQKRFEAIINGVKAIAGLPSEFFGSAVLYVDRMLSYSGGREKFG